MANRNFSRVQALEKEVKLLGGPIAISAGGVATCDIEGVASVAQNGSAQLTFTLDDAYPALLFSSVHVGGVTYELDSTNSPHTGVLVVEITGSTTPVSGKVGEAFFVMKNSTVGE